jgi:hypothetical protein
MSPKLCYGKQSYFYYLDNSILAHLAKGNVSFCHQLASVVR